MMGVRNVMEDEKPFSAEAQKDLDQASEHIQ
jgi:hypothetical protein